MEGISETQSWRIEDAIVRRPEASTRSSSLERVQTWASGVSATSRAAFTPSDTGKTFGAKMQPFQDWNIMIGTEMTRSGNESGFLGSKAMWESFWSQDVREMGGLKIGLSTVGSVDNAQTDYLQSFSGRLNVPLDVPLTAWNVEFRVSPSMNVDVSNGALHSNLLSEIMGEKVLSSRTDAFRSTINVSVGYSLAPEARPAASARLEFRLSPNL
ncbi:hypothetical protein [Microvirga solisilvae]|uniref:hypothetical protein n=1 Tax=Microvirga solisilvae TaxID=2919498 RepID=UPI001FAEF45E|nr:hypothetical protein [Microvirga solisilvae]